MIKNILLISIVATIFSGCLFGEKDKPVWTAYVYPDKTNTKRSLILPPKFPSLETCRKTALEVLKVKELENSGSYKCGKNCSYHEGMKLDICEEMKE